MSRRTATITFALALALLTTTACKDSTAGEPWVVDSINFYGPKIGTPDAEPGYYTAECIPKSAWRPDSAADGDVPFKNIKISKAVAYATNDGDPCPPGKEI